MRKCAGCGRKGTYTVVKGRFRKKWWCCMACELTGHHTESCDKARTASSAKGKGTVK